MDHQILYISRSDRTDPQERITHIGGRNHGGSQWKISLQAAIDGIDSGHWAFFVRIQERRIPVVAAAGRSGGRYLTTAVAGEEPNALLTLPECSSGNPNKDNAGAFFDSASS